MAVGDDRTAHSTDNMQVQKSENSFKKPITWCCQSVCSWCRKYFWEGQFSQDDIAKGNCDPSSGQLANMGSSTRKALSFLIPAVLFHMAWWSIMIARNLWYIFPQKYFMTLTMIFGSIVAGMTSTGGGAVAFPVMTLAFSVDPVIARDFSVMIQSCGMSAASFSIIFMKVLIEYHSILWCSIGGAVGVIFGLEIIDPLLSSSQKKMVFVSIWISFAFALFLLNLHKNRQTFLSLQEMTWWRITALISTGIIGGIFTSFSGSGIDIASFSVLTTLFRLSEKVATPTSVILMAGNSLICFFWRGLIMQDISESSWHFLLVCIPVVTLGAPVGSLLGTHFHRLVLAALIYIINTVALISAFVIVPQTPILIGSSVAIIAGGFFVFLLLTKLGEKLHRNNKDSMVCSNIKTVKLNIRGEISGLKISHGVSNKAMVIDTNEETSVTAM